VLVAPLVLGPTTWAAWPELKMIPLLNPMIPLPPLKVPAAQEAPM